MTAACLVVATLALVPVSAAPAAAASANAVDTTSRAAVQAAYLSRWLPSAGAAVTSTAMASSCSAGAVSPATEAATLSAMNLVRGLAQLDAVTTTPVLAARAQAAALVFARNDTISHYPPSSWPCWTSDAATAAASSNIGISWGRTPTAADNINGYLTERNGDTTNLGHRRWILYPQLSTTGVGVADNPATGSIYRTNSANVLYVLGDAGRNAAAASPSWVAWPTAGYFPAQLEPGGLWSLSSTSSGASFAAAQVTVTGPGGPLAVTRRTTANGYGNPTLAFTVSGVTAPAGGAEAIYTVSVTGITGVAATSHTYQVRLFDPAAPTVTAPASATVAAGRRATFAVATSGSPAPAVTWQRSGDGGANWVTVPGASGATLVVVASAADDQARYRAVATNGAGTALSAPATLTVIVGPHVVTEPLDTVFTASGEATLVADVAGTDGSTIGWQRWDGAAWGPVAGGGSVSLHLTGLTAADDGARLRLVVSSALGTATTRTATLRHETRAYVPVTPLRVLDARAGAAAGQVSCTQVTGPGTGIPAGIAGVSLNVTTVRPGGPGHVIVYPDSDGTGRTPAPWAASVNFDPGRDVATAALVEVPASGRVCTFVRGAATGLILDVNGYLLPGQLTLQMPQRLADHSGVTPGIPVTVQVTGRAGVPAGARAVLLTVAGAGSTGPGNLRLYAAGAALPATSVLNYSGAGDRSNAAVVELSASGAVTYLSQTGGSNPVRVVLDVVGYTMDGSAYVPVTPQRLVDTRQSGVLAAGGRLVVPVSAGAPAGASAVVLNVVGVTPTTGGNLRVFPHAAGSQAVTPTSTLNYIPGADIANMAVAGIGDDGSIVLYTDQPAGGRTHVVADVVGYLTNP